MTQAGDDNRIASVSTASVSTALLSAARPSIASILEITVSVSSVP